jgi:hypothetical protein
MPSCESQMPGRVMMRRPACGLEPSGAVPRSENRQLRLSEETALSDQNGRVLVAIALLTIAVTLTVGSLQLLMRLEVIR